MTNLVNLQRDQTIGTPVASVVKGIGASGPIGDTINAFCVDTVSKSFRILTNYNTNITTVFGNWRGVGIFTEAPVGVGNSYRVKIRASLFEAGSNLKGLYAFIGEAPGSIISGDNAITGVCAYPMDDGVFDDIVLVLPSATNPICFGVAAGECTAANLYVNMSLQSLAVNGPQFKSIES